MAWQAVTDVNDGGNFSGAVYQTVIDAIEELQDVVGTDETVENALVESGTYTPTLTNMDIGDGTNNGNYVFVGFDTSTSVGALLLSGDVNYGSGMSVSSGPTIAIPSGFNFDTTITSGGLITAGDFGASIGGTLYQGKLSVSSATTLLMRAQDASSTYLKNVAVTGSVPDSWASGDFIRWHASCRAVRT